MTYEDALAQGRKVGASHADDPALMALLCEDTLRTVIGAVVPKLVWEGAQKQGMTTQELVTLGSKDPVAVARLMWT